MPITRNNSTLLAADHSLLITAKKSHYKIQTVTGAIYHLSSAVQGGSTQRPHVYSNSSQLEEYHTLDYLKNVKNILVLPVQGKTCSIGE